MPLEKGYRKYSCKFQIYVSDEYYSFFYLQFLNILIFFNVCILYVHLYRIN